MHFDGQHIGVIGGSRGIGLAVAEAARQRGAKVTVFGRSAAALAPVAQRLGAEAVVMDVADEAAVRQAFAADAGFDHLYLAAGQFVAGSVIEGAGAALHDALDARVFGALHVVRAMQGRWRPGGSLVLTGGVSTARPVAEAWATAVATAAAEQLARALALALAPVRCNAVSPGWTDTPLWDSALGEGKSAAFAEVAGRLPVGRIASAAEVADAVLLLMHSRAITGEVLHVDGGHRLV